MRIVERLFLTLLLVPLLLAGCQQADDQPVRRTRMLMGTVVEITAFGPRDPTLAAVDAALDEMARIEQLMSPHIATSDLARLAERGEVDLHAETAEVLRLALAIHKAGDGAFDPTLGAVKELWDIEGDNPRVPDAQALRAALAATGVDGLELTGNHVRLKRPGIRVDLGGIAKGYAIDRAVAVLQKAGIEHASVNAGGDLRLIGDHNGRPWRIGIQHPRKPGAMLAVLNLENTAVVTSGDYERYFEVDGRRYHHLFDPKTGRPARACQSVTVVAERADVADALATAAFVLGPERGLALLQLYHAEGVIIDAGGTAHVSDGLRERIQWR